MYNQQPFILQITS